MPVDSSGARFNFGTPNSAAAAGRNMVQDALIAPSAGGLGAVQDGSRADSLLNPNTQQINPLWYLLAIVILLGVLKFAMEHEKSGLDPKIVGIGVANFVVIGVMATLWIAVEKIIVNKWHVNGLTDLINLV